MIFFTQITIWLFLVYTQPFHIACSNPDDFLTNRWPFTNGDLSDVIGNASMIQGKIPTQFAANKYGIPNSALNLNGGYVQLPAGVYFNSAQFSISVWVNPQNPLVSWSKIIDFSGEGAVRLTLSLDTAQYVNKPLYKSVNLNPQFCIIINNFYYFCVNSAMPLMLNQWQLVTASYDGMTAKLHLNGFLAAAKVFNYTLLHYWKTYDFTT